MVLLLTSFYIQLVMGIQIIFVSDRPDDKPKTPKYTTVSLCTRVLEKKSGWSCGVILDSSLLTSVLLCHRDTSLSLCLCRHLSHSSVDINVLEGDPQWTVRWAHEPTVNFPHKV